MPGPFQGGDLFIGLGRRLLQPGQLGLLAGQALLGCHGPLQRRGFGLGGRGPAGRSLATQARERVRTGLGDQAGDLISGGAGGSSGLAERFQERPDRLGVPGRDKLTGPPVMLGPGALVRPQFRQRTGQPGHQARLPPRLLVLSRRLSHHGDGGLQFRPGDRHGLRQALAGFP